METRIQQAELERSILGAIITPSYSTAPAAMADLRVEYFQLPQHRVIFKAIQRLFERQQQVDAITVSEELIAMNRLQEAGGRSYISDINCANTGLGEVLSPSWVGFLIERFKNIEMQRLVYKIEEACTETPDPDSVIQMVRTELGKLETLKKSSLPLHICEEHGPILEHIEHAKTIGGVSGIKSGYPDLDNALNGFKPEQFIIICGRPGMCKTTVMLNMAHNMAEVEQRKVLVYSLEASRKSTTMKIVSRISQVPYKSIESGNLDEEQEERVKEALASLADLDLYICDDPYVSLGTIQAHVEQAKRAGKPYDIVFIDYLQLIKTRKRKDDNFNLEIAEISRGLKLYSMSENMPIVALAQLNRGLEARQDKRPKASDLRDSGSLEQDADLILGVYRDEVYNPETSKRGELELLMLKNRHGDIRHTVLRFDARRCALYPSYSVR